MASKQVFNTSAELDYPTVLPTLDLDFANTKTLDPRITFTRASGGSYVGADGLIKYAGVNEARFDHDPITGESLGLLIEEARTNLLLRSEEFDDAIWSKARSFIVPNVIVAPDGSLSADKIVETTDSGTHTFASQSISATAQNYTVSVFVKKAERKFFQLFGRRDGTNYNGVLVDLDTGNTSAPTRSGTNNNASTTRVTSAGNGWWRISMTYTYTTTGTTVVFGAITDDNTTYSYPGDGTSGIYIWGAQLEEGTFPTSYIPTQASTRTRAADNASITGKNFSSFYRQDEGTIFSTTKSILTSSNGIIWVIDNSSTNTPEVIELFRVSINYRSRIKLPSNADIMFENVVFSDQDLNSFNNCIISYKKDDSTTFSNARNTFIVSRGNIPTFNRLRLSASGPQVKWISNFKYWPKRLPNEQIRTLTFK
jgi:hypothetical protein